MNKVAILYICTGKYDIFWEDFYKTSEKYFLNNSKKQYFVFTDVEYIYNEEDKNIHKIYQESLGWPYNTLMRFNMFKKIEDRLKEFDYIFFLNANMLFVQTVGEEILPIEEDLLVVKHPGFYDKSSSDFTYDRNVNSLAYIPYGEGEYYIAGGFNGGKSSQFIKLINELDENIQNDLDNDVIALWHDESHINKYILDKNYKILDPGYIYPEGWNLPFEKKIIVRDKNKWGGHAGLRGIEESKKYRGSVIHLLKKIKHKLIG